MTPRPASTDPAAKAQGRAPGRRRIFVAGASGVIGVRLVPLLVTAGHTVAAMTRTPAKAEALAALGAEPVVCDVFAIDRLSEAIVAFGPDTIIHQLTDLPDDAAAIANRLPATNRVRREGTRNLLAAARAAGGRRFLAQSVAWPLAGDAREAIAELEAAVLEARGVVLRYGRFHGPGTYYPDALPEPPRVHVDAAARRTIAVLDAPPGILTITD